MPIKNNDGNRIEAKTVKVFSGLVAVVADKIPKLLKS